jgi:hypothetical protein
MESDLLYFVLHGEALMLDERGAMCSCLVGENGEIDWESMDVVEWRDLSSSEYKIHRKIHDLLSELSTTTMYVK